MYIHIIQCTYRLLELHVQQESIKVNDSFYYFMAKTCKSKIKAFHFTDDYRFELKKDQVTTLPHANVKATDVTY